MTIYTLSQNAGHVLTKNHYTYAIVLALAILVIAGVCVWKYRARVRRYWRRLIIGAIIALLIIVLALYPKISFYYNTNLTLPSYLSAQEKKQFQDRRYEALRDKEAYGKNNSGLYNSIGIIRAAVKDYSGAVKSFQLSISKNPEDPRFYRNLAIAYTYLDKFKDAEVAFQQAFKLAPQQPEYWLELGELYTFKLKDNQKARTFYLEAISRTNTNINVAQGFANFLENVEKDYVEAVKYWQIVADGAPDQSKTGFLSHIAELKLRYNIK